MSRDFLSRFDYFFPSSPAKNMTWHLRLLAQAGHDASREKHAPLTVKLLARSTFATDFAQSGLHNSYEVGLAFCCL